MPSRAESKQETRDALIHAGLLLFARHGLDGPSLDAICARAGYTRGAFYVHFKDRDDFLVAVMERVGTAFLDAVIGGGLEPTVRRFLSSIADGLYPITRKGGVRPYQLYDACARSPAVRSRYVDLIGLAIAKLALLVSEEQRAGALRGDVAAGDAAGLLLALVIGAHTMLDLEVPLDYPQLARAALALLQPPERRRKERVPDR